MPIVKLRENESVDGAIRRLKRLSEKAGIPKELRRREFHQPRSKVKQREKAAAKKRLIKRLQRADIQLKAASIREKRH